MLQLRDYGLAMVDAFPDAESKLAIARNVDDLRRQVSAWRAAGESIALVPTMGALHDAHMRLVEAGQHACQRTVVSIFVNPKQFGENEDFGTYPRTEQADLDKLVAAQVDLAFVPDLTEMYGDGFVTTVSVAGITEGLCGDHRAGHFDGVATVVTKLFMQAMPDVAVFGEKDYQQLRMITQMTRDLDIPVRILPVETVREADGLAISSRNVNLKPDERRRAGLINRVLADIAGRMADGGLAQNEIPRGLTRLRELGLGDIDYLEIRDSETLEKVTRATRPARVLVALHIGDTRLIDNLAIMPRDAG